MLGDPGYQTVLFAVFVGPALLMMPVWPRIGSRWGKLFGFRVASLAFGIALVVALALAVMAYGGYLMTTLPIDVFPDLDRPRVVILTECPGLSPEEVETLVTQPVESRLLGVATELSGGEFVLV